MKTLQVLIITFTITLFTACSGSETYRGTWKATDSDGNKLDIFFDAKSLTISDSTGDKKDYSYSQNSVEITNGTETYGIVISDVGTYSLYFPFSDESKGFITDANGNVLYTINRTSYMTYQEANRLK